MRTRSLLSFLILLAAVDARAQCDPALTIPGDGTAIPNDIVISEINPGNYIELYNRTSNTVNLSGWWFCSPFVYASLGATSIGPFSYKTYAWPGTFADTDAGGEIQLYDSVNFGVSTDIIDFVCWGVNPHGSRKGQAESVGKWIGPGGPCAPAIPAGGAIHRINNTTGTSAASYDVTLAPSPMNCTGTLTGIGDAPAHPSISLAVSPNPFSALVTIQFELSSAAQVKAEVYTVTGARVRTLENAAFAEGSGRLLWDGTDGSGRALPSGTYLLKVTANNSTVTQRVTILR